MPAAEASDVTTAKRLMVAAAEVMVSQGWWSMKTGE
jgi:hypothetical protein